MKKTLLTITLALASLAAFAQGTVNFDNSPLSTGGTVDAKIYLDVVGGTALAGTEYFAQIYGGSAADNLAASGAIATFYPSGSGGEGYVNPSGQSVAILGVTPGQTAFVQVRAWTGAASWEAATIRGQSGTLQLTTGGAGAPPSLPTNLVGLQSFAIAAPVPEPSTIALGVLGAGSLLFLRRKK